MIPAEAMIFTIYRLIDGWRLLNTMLGPVGIVYIATVLPFTIWTLRGFVAGVPAELEEAAMIDGLHRSRRRSGGSPSRCSPPASSPPASSRFIQAWNEFTIALVLKQGRRP